MAKGMTVKRLNWLESHLVGSAEPDAIIKELCQEVRRLRKAPEAQGAAKLRRLLRYMLGPTLGASPWLLRRDRGHSNDNRHFCKDCDFVWTPPTVGSMELIKAERKVVGYHEASCEWRQAVEAAGGGVP